MLLHQFFEIKKKSVTEGADKTKIDAQVVIHRSHPIFDGHFPNLPIVPGVCMVEMTKEILENHLNTKLFLPSSANIKFLSIINPDNNNELNVEIEFSSSLGTYLTEARLFWGEITFFKMKGNFSTQL